MKTKGISFRKTCGWIFIFLGLCFPSFVQAQFVNDSQTNVLDGVATNAANVTVGTNSSFTLLVVTNGSVVTNLGNLSIGANASASSNRLAVGGAGSVWNSSAYMFVGNSGSFNELDIVAGGTVSNSYNTYIADQSASSNNTVWVSGAGSLWQCGNELLIGYSTGGNNQLVISNGATVFSGFSVIGPSGGRNNSATVTGANSIWTNAASLDVGAYSPKSLLVITNGGTAFSGGLSGLGMLGASSVSNRTVITDLGSVWTCAGNPNYFFYVGEYSGGNELDILNGGNLITFEGIIGNSVAASNNFALISGPGSLWTNQLDCFIGRVGASSNRVFVTDSGALQARTLYVGYDGNGNQLVVSNAATVTVSNLVVGTSNSKSNSIILSGGTINLTNAGLSLASFATVTINSGLLTTPSINSDLIGGPYGSAITLNGGKLQSGGTSYLNPTSFTIGDGTDAATFEMLFELIGGNNNNHSFSGGVTVSNNGLLKGFGTVKGNISVNSGGTISPGTNVTIGSITQLGNLTLYPGSTTRMKLNALPGTSDTILGMTNLTYGGTLQVTNLFAPFAAGKSYKLFSATNYFGAFNNLVPATPGTGLRWDTNELNVDGVLRVFSITTTPPIISGITATNSSLVLGATGGIPYDPCYLLTSSNLTDWSCVATNYFDFTGATSFTNSIPPDAPQGFFRLQVN